MTMPLTAELKNTDLTSCKSTRLSVAFDDTHHLFGGPSFGTTIQYVVANSRGVCIGDIIAAVEGEVDMYRYLGSTYKDTKVTKIWRHLPGFLFEESWWVKGAKNEVGGWREKYLKPYEKVNEYQWKMVDRGRILTRSQRLALNG